MRKLLLISLCLMATTAFSAPRFGVKGGAMLGNVDEDFLVHPTASETTNRTGLVVGVWGETPLVVLEGFAIRGDVLYAQKGAKYEIFSYDVTVIADELTVTPFLVYYFPTKVIRPFLEAGPELGLTLADGVKVGGDKFDSGGAWKDTNFSLNIGGGVEFSLGSRAIALELKYNRGLTNMGGWAESAPGYPAPNVKTHGIQLLAGIQLF
ncbi:PorT family protein [bacterium]|nr:PorT family protein [bacterium]